MVKVRVMIFEDKLNYIKALSEAFEDSERVFLAKSFTSADKAVKMIKEYKPDITLMDIEMPGKSGLDAMKEIYKDCPGAKVTMLTQFDDDHRIFTALCCGAVGYALKSDSSRTLEEIIMLVHQYGGYFSPSIAGKVSKLFATKQFMESPEYVDLTPREKEVLGYLGQAYKYQMIADTLFVDYQTIKSHINNIYHKLHVSSKSAAILKAIELRLIP